MNPETRPLFLRCTADGKRFPDDHKFRGQRGRFRARYRRPQLGRGTEKIGETSQRTTNLQLASGAFSCKVALSRRQVSARRKLHRTVDAQAATANSIPLSSTAKFSRNGVLVAPLRGELRATRTKPISARAAPLSTLTGWDSCRQSEQAKLSAHSSVSGCGRVCS